ncbi:MAG: serine/threonine protein kinase [Planctomycetes bacterium]|nr:serine/threonine protein kinase [Planctomycetota bacterium]
MAEIQDSEFLRILRESPVVSPEQVRSAQELQRDELDRQGSCRSLFAILCARGLIDDRAMQTIKPPPTVVLAAADGPKTPGSPSSISAIRSARKRPPEAEAAAADPRNVLGPYVLLKEVGKGGMGRVYRAWDENVGRIVALKVIDTEDVADRERFVREAQIAGRLSHPSIATVFHAGEQGSRGWIAMQFIEGGPIDAQPLPLLSALALIRDAAQALSYAHDQGVVHRDVKPGNLMVDGKGRVFLTDFGLAKEVVGNVTAQLSITGTTFGTPQFMSPEQARGEHRRIDGRSDIYSLGATLYALLARRPPFVSKNLATLLLEVLDKTPPRLSRFNREISPELEMLVERSMAKDPSRRFATMGEFAAALDRMIGDGRFAGRYGIARSVARRWLPRLAVAAALGAALWFGIPRMFAAPKPADPAPRLYADAIAELRTLEDQNVTPEIRRDRVVSGVLRPLTEVLRLKPGDLRARAAKVRALYAAGDREAAARELAELGRRKEDDYRLLLVSALLDLEDALAKPCPLPLLECPGFEWDRRPAPLAAEIKAVARAKVGSDLAAEYKEDGAAIQGLTELAAGDYGKAADLLRPKRLPVFRAAWCRAAYLARRFDEVLQSEDAEGRREHFGAGLAIAASTEIVLVLLLDEAGADAPLVHAAIARIEGASDLEKHLKAAWEGADAEHRAALLSARLRAKAPAWADGEKEYREAMALAGDAPATWPGRLAAIELRLGLGTRLLRSRGDGKALLEEALRRADELAKQDPGWAPPRLLAAQARLRLGRLDELKEDLPKLGEGVRAGLIAAAAELSAAEREFKAGRPYADLARAAQQKARAASRDHAETGLLTGAASLLLARQEVAENRDESDFVTAAVESFKWAIECQGGLMEARYHRGRALFLLAEIRRRGGGDGRAEEELARADADAVLAAAPDFQPARYLRANVNFSLGKDAEAVADWRALIQADPSWDTPDLRSWIQRALDRQNK